ncbi:Eukaryotic/viral aspartic protease, partial [Phytophthora megakarya]
LAEPAVDADYLFAIAGEVKWPEDREMGFVNTTEIVEENDTSLGENEMGEVDAEEYDGYLAEVSASSWEPNETSSRGLVQTAKLLPGERLGWWSSQRYDKRKRMRAVVMGAIDDTRTRILLDTGANVSVISAAYAKRLRETRRRTLVKITLGWEGCEWRELRLPRKRPSHATQELWIQRSRQMVPTVIESRTGKPVGDYKNSSVVLWIPKGVLPREVGYVRLDSSKYKRMAGTCISRRARRHSAAEGERALRVLVSRTTTGSRSTRHLHAS